MTARPKSRDEQIWVRVSPELKAWIAQQAKTENRSLSNWIATMLETLMNNDIKNEERNHE